MYAYAVDGLDREQRDLFDRNLAGASGGTREDARSKAREQRQAQEALMAAFGKARG